METAEAVADIAIKKDFPFFTYEVEQAAVSGQNLIWLSFLFADNAFYIFTKTYKTTKNHKNRLKNQIKTTTTMLNFVDTPSGMTYNEHRILCHGTAKRRRHEICSRCLIL